MTASVRWMRSASGTPRRWVPWRQGHPLQDILSAQGQNADELRTLTLKADRQQHLHLQQYMSNMLLELNAKLDRLAAGHFAQQQRRIPSEEEVEDEELQSEDAPEEEGEVPARAAAAPAPKRQKTAAPPSEDKASFAPAPVRLSKPAIWDGTGNAEDRLFIFESYLKGSKIAESDWVLHAQPLLAGAALSAWVAVAKSAPAPASWSLFRQTMLGAFATQDAAMQARKKLHKIRQTPSETVVEYVRRSRLLIAQLGAAAPAESDKILWMHAGLTDKLKSAALVDPQTGSFWSSFEALAQYLVALSASMPATTVSAPASVAGPRFSRVHVMKTQGTKKKLSPANRPFVPRKKPQQQQQQQQHAPDQRKASWHDLPIEEKRRRTAQQLKALDAEMASRSKD